MRDYGMDSSFMSKSCQPAHKENLKKILLLHSIAHKICLSAHGSRKIHRK